MVLAVMTVGSTSYRIFIAVDEQAAVNSGKSLYYAGYFLQSYWLYIVSRDVMITLRQFCRGNQEAFVLTVLLHYVTSCLDNILLTGLTIWSTIALKSEQADEYAKAAEETGLGAFVTVTTVNVVMAYLYITSHICALPIGSFIVSRDPERFGLRLRREPQDWDDEALDSLANQ